MNNSGGANSGGLTSGAAAHAELSRRVAAQARGRSVDAVLTPAAREAIAASSRMLRAATEAGAVYGVTTGVGALRDVAVADEEAAGHGLRLWRSHAGAFGPELDDTEARATMLVRLHQLAAGSTGVSVELAEGLERAVLAGAVPVLHSYGSIGTADLTVLAQLGLALVGERPWRTTGTMAPEPAPLPGTDALAFISSNAMTAGLGALAHDSLAGLLQAAERVAALSFVALRGSAQAYDRRVHERKDDVYAAEVALRMRVLLGDIAPGARVQDPFALRTVPQVHGVAAAALDAAAAAVSAEIGAPAENPLPVEGLALHHGLFLTQRLAASFDAVREALVAVATLSQARVSALIDPRLTGLPAFLASGAPGSSGLMILEYVVGDLVARVRATALPSTLTRTVVSLGMEEVASHSTQAVFAARSQAALLPDVLACELVSAVRALRMAPERLDSAGGEVARLAAHAVEVLGDAPLEDHVLGDELRAAAGVVAEWAGGGAA